jgi:hypothetical protein
MLSLLGVYIYANRRYCTSIEPGKDSAGQAQAGRKKRAGWASVKLLLKNILTNKNVTELQGTNHELGVAKMSLLQNCHLTWPNRHRGKTNQEHRGAVQKFKQMIYRFVSDSGFWFSDK